jgi:TonB-dependent starch-binding outer membrane protein SusC
MIFIRLTLFLAAFSLPLVSLHAQMLTIRGTVSSAEDGLPVIGATVTIKAAATGTITDIDGSYTLQVPDENTILVFSYVGLKQEERRVGSLRQIDVVLSPDVSILKEVVVVGYGTLKRSNISGAVSTVTAEEITQTPILRTEQALQGRTAGVQVTQNSGAPGSALTVRIRGIGTINNSDPLYIVDGIPVEGIDFLNPSDIESINVLKDAASAAIYGSRGANGVVLITTKGGKKQQDGTISYEAYYGVQSPWKLINLLSAREYAILSNEAHIAAGKVPRPEFANPDLLGEGTDWLSAIFQDAPMSNHQLTLSGGSEKSTYTVSGNYFRQDGIVGGEKSGFERYTVRLNTNNEVKKWLSIGNTLGITHLKRQFLPENNEFTTPLVRALNMDPVTRVRRSDGEYAYSLYADTDIVNPLNAIDQTHDRWTTNRLVGAVFAELKPAKGLSLKSTYSTDVTFAQRNTFFPAFDLSLNPELSDAPGGEKNLVNSVVLQHNHWKNWQWENVLSYQTTLAQQHELTLIAGTTALANRFDYSGGANTNLPTNDPKDAFISNTIDPITSQSTYAGATESSLLSVFSRVNYAYADKYLLSATFRADGSSRFGNNNRFGYFPSLSGGWVISREDFFSSEDLSFLKLRASWGRNGNDRIGDYSFTTIVNAGQNYTFGPGEVITNGAVPLVAANPDLKWETVTQSNIGLDAELWNGKLNISTDYYIKTTTDMLYAAPIPLVAGTLPPVRNIGTVDNSGLEIAAQYRNRTSAFSYSIGGNIAFVSNQVTGLGAGGDPVLTGRIQSANATVSRTEVGRPIASFYGFVTDGIFQTSEEVAAHAFQNELTRPGDIRFKDLNGDGVIDILDQTFIGDPTPDFTFGLNADCAYKGFDFSIFILGSQGNDIYNATVRYDFSYVNRPVSALNRWTGIGSSNTEPRVNLNDPNQNARVSDRFIEDGSFVRVKNMQIGYSLPETISKKWNIRKFRVYASASNLFTFTRYSGLDPEIGALSALEIGIDRGFYPQSRSFLAGISLTF